MSSARSCRHQRSPGIYDGPQEHNPGCVNLNTTSQTLTDCLVPWVADLNSELAHPDKPCRTKLGNLVDSIIFQLKLQWLVVTPALVISTNILHTLTDVMAITRACRNHYDQDYANHHYYDSTSDWSDSTTPPLWV